MAKPVHITNNIERRTYVKGQLRAKYIGFLDDRISDKSHMNFYDLEIIEAIVEIDEKNIRKWQDGGIFEEFIHLDLFPSKLPADSDFCIISEKGEKRHFRLTLFDLRIKDPVITDRIIEEERVFGTLTGVICGYFLHYDQETRIVFVEEEDNSAKDDNSPSSREISGRSSNNTASFPSLVEVLQTLASGMAVILGIMVAIPVILYSFPIIIFAGAAYGLSYLSSVVPKATRQIASVFNTLLFLLFILLFLAGLVSYINQGTITPVVAPADQSNEKSSITPLPTPDSLQISDVQPTDTLQPHLPDSVIRHYRVWQGYNGERYSGYLGVRTSSFRASAQYRNQAVRPVISPAGFDAVFGSLDQFDRAKLGLIYSLFDSLEQANKLDRMQFAEMIVSCIQDIPYTLILEQECSPWKYQDAFVRDYLNSGGKCRPYVKYGVLSPVEFIATLEGDCDTRALLLYSVLRNYEYDVTLLVSNYYQHAVLGINLPYRGLSKTINGKRYVVWETTAEGVIPGQLPRQMSNMDF